MEIKKVISDKKEFLELLLLADEQESMIDRYLERGDMFVLYDDGLKACCVVTCEGEGIYEIKNIATISFFQRLQSPNQKIPDRKTKCVIETHLNIKQNVIFGANLKPV